MVGSPQHPPPQGGGQRSGLFSLLGRALLEALIGGGHGCRFFLDDGEDGAKLPRRFGEALRALGEGQFLGHMVVIGEVDNRSRLNTRPRA
jgi:hypothetical protein